MGQREGTVRRDDTAVFQHQLKSWKTCFFFFKEMNDPMSSNKMKGSTNTSKSYFVFRVHLV